MNIILATHTKKKSHEHNVTHTTYKRVYLQRENDYTCLVLLYSIKLQKKMKQNCLNFDKKCDYAYALIYVISLRPGF